jgi:hypothetical protein
MVRFNYRTEQELIEEYYMEPEEFFCCSLGPFLFYFEDGLVVGGSSNPSRNTVLMWVERNEIGEHREWLQEEDKRAVPFYAKDFDDWKIYLNQVVKSVTIIKELPYISSNRSSRYFDLPNERGVLIEFENGTGLIMSHGLNDDSDDTTLAKPDGIDPAFEGHLEYIPVI